MFDPEAVLAGTPYLTATDSASLKRLEAAHKRSQETRASVVVANERIMKEAHAVLEPYLAATRTDLVAESNVIEGYSWTQEQVREVVATHRELLNGPVRTLVESVRGDARVYEVLGLFRAHEIAEAWSRTDRVPRTHEIRELHRLILGDVPGAGTYKMFPNAISGASHRTTPPEDVARVMLELADWWGGAEVDPLLTATVAHAWLVHMHPFEDGNGRLARILANLELARHDYPPLVIRAASDRGEYYSSLAASDDGDILPLYELFGRVLRRQAKIMGRPSYVLDLIEDRLLASESQRYAMWKTTLDLFSSALHTRLTERGAVFDVQGELDPGSFGLLCERDLEGNGWYATVGLPHRLPEWLLWFGFRTWQWLDIAGDEHVYPSVFLSRRDYTPEAPHPYTQHFDQSDLEAHLPDEISIVPAVANPINIRRGLDLDAFRAMDAANLLVPALVSGL